MATAEILQTAVELHQTGRLDEAQRLYRQILATEPGHADAWHLSGLIDYQQGRLREALESITRAIEADGRQAGFYNHLAEVQRALLDLPAAEQSCRKALELRPDYALAHNTLGLVHAAQGRPQEAIAAYRRAIQHDPQFAQAYCNLGTALHAGGAPHEAAAHFRQALAANPNYALAHFFLANALRELEQLPDALAAYQRALSIDPRLASAHNDLGTLLQALGRFDEARASYERALAIEPNHAEAHNNLGTVHKMADNFVEASRSYERAVALRPDFAEAHNNLGNIYKTLGRHAEALAAFDAALALRGDFVQAHYNRALANLMAGKFVEGWRDYEWRWKLPEAVSRPWTAPAWDGSPLAGRTILLYPEQGFGDALQFIRYAPLVSERGGRVMVACPARLIPILSTCPGVERVCSWDETLPAHDVCAALMSLPMIFGTTPETIPANVPYLNASAELIAQWRTRLAAWPGFKIGIHWHSSNRLQGDKRSIPLVDFEPLARVPGVTLLSLQKGAPPEQIAAMQGRWTLVDFGDELDGAHGAFMDSAAILSQLDLLITCDTSLAHLAGALGTDVWVALPLAPDWRWMLERDDTPWYPTMRLFRQQGSPAWQGVISRMIAALPEAMRRRASVAG